MQPSTTPPDLFRRIDCWAQEVVKETEQYPQRQNSVHYMKLRSRPTRQHLSEISVNTCSSRKRKALETMSNTINTKAAKKAELDTIPRGRGRPLGSKNRVTHAENHGVDEDSNPLPLRNPSHVPSSVPDLLPPSASSARRAKSGSPTKTKRGDITLDKQKSEAAIDMAYLARCSPAVKKADLLRLRAVKKKIPEPVLYLHGKLSDLPHSAIPFKLKVDCSLPSTLSRRSCVAMVHFAHS